ncbi:hypothetical protein SAMN04489761_0306 [Tenacibaculum sp. MAR_2009_124]|uniref:hypothetical protein n=1 Tax=Tenacibaculum sp. MAR_2009_124 TaxID=1250059 RepID=UPI000897B76E|nr:hypothetical protein [Tenacibaculum sp. MAR_2009_124]SEB38082.1 hypothetical protein SAMN04489761_0306 [Tenacibaculum sp. MAR_2009_124]
MKKLAYYAFTALILFNLGCSNEDMTAPPEVESLDQQDDPSFKNDVFDKNGLNRTYLEESSLSEEDFYTQLNEEGAILSNSLEEKQNDYSQNKNVIIDKSDLAGALASLIYEIKDNPGNYFKGEIGFNSTYGSYFNLGLNNNLIRSAVQKFPSVRIDKRTGKKDKNKHLIDLNNFSLLKMEIVGQNTVKIKIKGNFRYRYYRKIFKKYRRLLDRRGTAEIELPLIFNTVTNSIQTGTAKINKIDISSGFNLFFVQNLLINVIVKKFVSIKQNFNLNISYDFLPKQYIEFKGLKEDYYNGQRFTFFKFDIKDDAYINNLRSRLQQLNIQL